MRKIRIDKSYESIDHLHSEQSPPISQERKKNFPICNFHKRKNSLKICRRRIQRYSMNTELLLLIKKHTDMFIEQTETRPQETLEYKLSKQK